MQNNGVRLDMDINQGEYNMRFIKELNGSFETNENEAGYDMKKLKSVVRKMSNEFKKEFGDVIENVKLSAGFFYMSGFFTRKRDN